MSTTPLRIEDGIRPRDWQPRKSSYKVPLRLMRLCLLGILLPSVFIAWPLYLRYRVYSEQLYALTISDQILIDGRISTLWCQSQVVKVNATFNAYLMSNEPIVEKDTVPVSMTRHLVMTDDMKEYWGFYLLRGSSVTVSACVRWPGASLTIIRGFKNLHECAFIGDDSSEELEELVEVAKEQGLLDVKGTTEAARLSNVPDKMRRADQDVHFYDSALRLNVSKSSGQPGSHELDPETMRNILTQLLVKTNYAKKKQKKNPHHHYEAVFRDVTNIDKPATTNYPRNLQDQEKLISKFDNNKETENDKKFTPLLSKVPISFQEPRYDQEETSQNYTFPSSLRPHSTRISSKQMESSTRREIVKEQEELKTKRTNSEEVFQDVLQKINSLGDRGKQILHKLMDTIDTQADAKGAALKQLIDNTMNDKKLSNEAKQRRRRDLVLSSPLYQELTENDEDGDAAVEEDLLHPDGIAEDRGTVNETTLNDRSNSEFWSSFSSSEERLLECKGLILNLPLTPHRYCTPKHESHHSTASFANMVTYRVPLNGYYFFVFNSENEVQPNYVRVKFDLLKTVYNTSNPVHACKNSTKECSLPFKIFSNEKTVLELPLSGNDSQWNEEYIGVSVCEPRTMVYTICVIMVPLLILLFAFH